MHYCKLLMIIVVNLSVACKSLQHLITLLWASGSLQSLTFCIYLFYFSLFHAECLIFLDPDDMMIEVMIIV